MVNSYRGGIMFQKFCDTNFLTFADSMILVSKGYNANTPFRYFYTNNIDAVIHMYSYKTTMKSIPAFSFYDLVQLLPEGAVLYKWQMQFHVKYKNQIYDDAKAPKAIFRLLSALK